MKEIIKNTLMAIKNYPYLKNNALNDVLGCGWIGEEALAIALFCATTGRDFKTVLEVSSNHSGDSDSTAMLSIGLWYLKTRDDSFLNDAETINKLDLKNCIENYMNSI